MNIPNPFQEFFRDLTALGGLTLYVVILALTLVFHYYTVLVQLGLGLLMMIVVTMLIRVFYFKNRPRKQDYRNILERLDASSFPSLHTARVVFLAFMAYSVFHNQYVTMVAVLLAALVSYSRIYLQKHDWWDLLGGVVLGGVTWVVVG